MPISSSTVKRAAADVQFPRWSPAALLFAAIAAAGFPGSQATAEDSILTWIVKSISFDEDGDVIKASALQAPQAGVALMTGQRISTGTGQHMVLVNGRDLIEVEANTTISIGDNDAHTSEANVDVVTGAIHVEVGKRAPGQTFSIGAPYLLATVKGTKFDVSTSGDSSMVSVTEGLVAVSATATGKAIDVAPGKSAVVSRHALGVPTLAPTRASATTGVIGGPDNLDSASANTGGSGAGQSGDGSSKGGDTSGGDGSGGGLGGAVGGAAGAAGDAVGGGADAVGGAVGGAADAVGGAVGGKLGGAVSDVGGAVGGTVSGVGGAVGGVGGALGGALGGLGGKR